jgi:hypothetical protein
MWYLSLVCDIRVYHVSYNWAWCLASTNVTAHVHHVVSQSDANVAVTWVLAWHLMPYVNMTKILEGLTRSMLCNADHFGISIKKRTRLMQASKARNHFEYLLVLNVNYFTNSNLIVLQNTKLSCHYFTFRFRNSNQKHPTRFSIDINNKAKHKLSFLKISKTSKHVTRNKHLTVQCMHS